jgi:heat shock protein 5
VALCLLYVLAGLVDETRANEKQVDGDVIGIDLGTTYSCVGVYKNGRVEILQNDQGNRITPSVVAFTQEGRLIGEAAKNQAALNPTNTVYDAKRLIGRAFYDDTVQADMKLWPFEVVNKDGKPMIEVEDGGKTKTMSPEEVSAMVLGRMKQIAEGFLGTSIKHAVVTCPAYFNDGQRKATKDAGIIAGLDVLRVINEPTAAALAYGLDRKDGDEQNILVFDLGGGTFDVTVLTIENGIFEVASTSGDTHLGGEDFDQRIMDEMIKVFKRKHKKDMSEDKRALQKLRRAAEGAKRTLSTNMQARLEVEALYDGIDFSENLTRAKFESLCLDLFKKTMGPVKRALKDSKLGKSDIDEVVLVGGSTRIPKVQSLLSDFFNGKELNQEINPDEAVAYGAAVQGGILSGEGGEAVKDVVLLDVAPLSLGTETDGGLFVKVIERNSVIPAKKTDEFTTVTDKQTTVNIKVYEGERSQARHNHLLGEFDLTGIAPAKKGVPKILLTYDIDQNGILKVDAVDKASGSQQKITITQGENRLSQDQMDKMVEDAKSAAEADRVFAQAHSARRELEEFLVTLKEYPGRDNLKLRDQRKLDSIVGKAEDFLKDSYGKASAKDYKSKMREVEADTNPITAMLYEGGDIQGGDEDYDFPDDDATRDEM